MWLSQRMILSLIVATSALAKPRLDKESVDEQSFLRSGDIGDASAMPNIGYVFRGYDIMKGNPLPTEPLKIDPGFQRPIFKASYESGAKTSDQRYLKPDGTSIQDCSGSCSLDFQSRAISDTKSYQESLSLRTSLEAGGFYGVYSGKFSASVGYKEVEERTSSQSHVFTESSASCCSYLVQTLAFTPPPLSDDFRSAVGTLTDNYDEDTYFRLIDFFGTHFISQVQLGALFGQQTEISKEVLTTMKEKGIDISTAASLSAYGITGSVNFKSDTDKKWAEEFASNSTYQKTFTIGAPPPEDNKMETWAQHASSAPVPMKVELLSIMDIFNGNYDIKVSDAVKENLKNALVNYCGVLVKRGVIKDCSGGASDPKPGRMCSFSTTRCAGIAGYNDGGQFKNQTWPECEKLCCEDKNCKSFDYRAVSGYNCALSYVTKDEVPTGSFTSTSDCSFDFWSYNEIQKEKLPGLPKLPSLGKWNLLFRQTLNGQDALFKKNEWSRNTQNVDAPNFSILEDFERFRRPDGKFHLFLWYPELGEGNEWTQTSNPVTQTSGGVANYEAITISSSGSNWGGLEYNGGVESLLDGSIKSGSWWYAIGVTNTYGKGIPGLCDNKGHWVSKVELYVDYQDSGYSTLRTGANQEKGFLSSTLDGKIDMYYYDDQSGRQRWTFKQLHDDVYNILLVYGEKYLSLTASGDVDLNSKDDESGRQKWRIQKLEEGTYIIKNYGGSNQTEDYLSCTADGSVGLVSNDDKSGRQQWKIEKLNL